MFTDGVDDLVDHDFAELELLAVLSINVLGDHGGIRVSGRPAVCVVFAILIIVIVKSRDTGVLANATVALSASAVVLPAEVEGLEEEQDGDLDNSEQEKNHLYAGLTGVKLLFDRTRRKEHVNQHVEQTRGLLSNAVPVDAPFVNDTEDQVAEDGLEEDHARNEVAPDVNRRTEVTSVDVAEAQVVGHVSPTHNNRQLHLVGVGEEQIVLGVVPAPIQTEWVGVALDASCGKCLLGLGVVAIREVPFPHGREQGKLLGEDITVDQTGVHGEDSHHQHDVATIERHTEKLILLSALQGLLPVDHGGCGESHDGTVTKITEHDGEQEREGDDGRQTRVDFGVLGSTICVNDGLETDGEFVGLVVGGWRLGSLDLVNNRRDAKSSVVVDILKRGLDQTERVGRAPSLSNQGLACRVVAEAVESLVHSLLLLGDDHPGGKRATDLVELSIQSALGVAQDVRQILKARVDLVDLVSAQFAVLVDVVNACAQALRNLADLRDDLLAVGEDDEDVLVHLFVVLGVDDGVRDFALVHVQVATQSTPQDALEGAHSLSRDDTSNKANVHHAEALLLRCVVVSVGLLHVAQQRRVVGRVDALPDLFRLASCAVKESTSLTQYPTPLGEFSFPLLECLVALVQALDARLKALAAVGKFVNLGGRRRGHVVGEVVDGAHADAISLDLLAEVVELAFDVVKAANLLGEGSLEGGCLWVQLRTVSIHTPPVVCLGCISHL